MRKFNTGATRDDDTNKLDLAWAAGFYDGEGSVSCTSNNGKPFTRVQLSIGQKNDGEEIAEVLLRFQRAVGLGNIYRKTAAIREIDQHQFLISKFQDVKDCLRLLWPYLSTIKKHQAIRASNLLKATTGKELVDESF